MNELTIKIDGQPVRVAPGTTILEAARRLGIEIPTMCHVDGFEPASSCFICAVQIEGRPTLSPSCAMPVAPGMVVTTSSDDVRASRKMALELLLSDHAGDCIAPCRASCPAGLDIPGFVYEIANGHPTRTMEVIAETLALPGALGRVCPRLCEEQCRRNSYDESLAIGTLHRFAAEKDIASGDPYLPPQAPPTGKNVAMIGAGPASLAAAYYLLQKGHGCTLYDAQPEAGGMLRYGIPEYRLPKSALDAEIELVRRLGARFEMNRRWGKDFSLAELRERFDAAFIAIGAQGTQKLRCDGEELALSGIAFLDRVAKGARPEIGDTVIVLGGGNTAMDACRTALRLGASKVTVLYRRTRNEMPCLLEEVEAAEKEGVNIEYLVAPVRLERSEPDHLTLTCARMELGEVDASGRRRPVPLHGSEFSLQATTVIAAVGQTVDCRLAESEGLEVTDWGIAADPGTLATSVKGVFAGGDAVSGANLAVRAVAAGRQAAVSIDQHLRGRPLSGSPTKMNILMRSPGEEELAAIFRRIERTSRIASHELELADRQTSFKEVDASLTPEEAMTESRRCLSCGCRKADGCRLRRYGTEYGVDPYRYRGERREFSQDLSHGEVIYEPGKCILCDACVRVASASGEELGLTAIGRGFQVTVAVPFDGVLADGLRDVARRCAEVCPTGALALKTDRACDACSGCTFHSLPDG